MRYATTPRGNRAMGAGNPLQQLMGLMGSTQGQYNEARAANEERYNTILDRDLDTRNRLLDYLKNFGDSQVADTNQAFDNNLQDSLAQLSNAGMLGSTVQSAVRARNTKERTDALRRVKDALAQNMVNVDERASNRLSDFQERRQDPYPDNTNLNSMASQIMQLMAENGQLKFGNNGRLSFTGGSSAPGYVSGHSAPGYQAPAASPSLTALRQADSAKMAGIADRNAKAKLMSAYGNYGARGTNQDAIDEAQYQLLLQGFGDWSPAQTVTTVRNMNPNMGNNPALYQDGFNGAYPSIGPDYGGGYAYHRPSYLDGLTPTQRFDAIQRLQQKDWDRTGRIRTSAGSAIVKRHASPEFQASYRRMQDKTYFGG